MRSVGGRSTTLAGGIGTFSVDELLAARLDGLEELLALLLVERLAGVVKDEYG